MILAILQARTSSNRLPGKVLLPLLGRPMILHELDRIVHSREIDKVVLATSTEESDDALAFKVESEGFPVYRGSLHDVLGRYYACAKEYMPAHVVRFTGDCPVIDWRLADEVIRRHMDEGNEYTRTSERFPDGLDTEIMTFQALKKAHENAQLLSEREHVTLYLRSHPESFRLGEVEAQEDWASLRWTVDEAVDFALMKRIFSLLYPVQPDFSMEDILDLIKKHPALAQYNAGILRNEGLFKSLQHDKVI